MKLKFKNYHSLRSLGGVFLMPKYHSILGHALFYSLVIFLGYFYGSHFNSDLIDQGLFSEQNKLASDKEKSRTERTPSDIQEAEVSALSNDDLPKSDVLEIQDPDLVEIVGFPKLVQINVGEDVITREFSSMELRKFPVITLENSSNYINALKLLVEEGSGPAAYKLRSMLESCLTAPRDEVAYRQNERTILQENRTTHGMSVDQHLTYNHAQFLRCQGVNDEDLQQASLDQLFDLAIENGSQIALSDLVRSHFSNGDYDEAGARLKELWDNGDTNSGGTLGLVYERTDFDGPDPTKPNLVKSYAYQFARDIVNTAAHQTGDYFSPPLTGGGQSAKDRAVSELTPQQLIEAELLA